MGCFLVTSAQKQIYKDIGTLLWLIKNSTLTFCFSLKLFKEPKTTLIHWLYEIPFGVYMYTLWLYISGKLMEIIEIDPNLIILILGFNHVIVLLILLLFSDVQKGAKDLGLNIDEKDLNEIKKSLNNLKSSLIQEFNNLKFWAKNNKWKIIYSIYG